MSASSALHSFECIPATSSLCSSPMVTQQQPNMEDKSTVPVLPVPGTSSKPPATVSVSTSCPTDTFVISPATFIDGYSTPKSSVESCLPQTQAMSAVGKRKRFDRDDPDLRTPPKRRSSGDFLRKGQWTTTEERLTRLLIEAFEEGCLPIYTGTRLRGYLAVQLQCDPMRVSKKLCAGTIDGKHVPKNYGQKKFKLRKKPFWDSDKAASRMTQLERLSKALWNESHVRKPTFLTLSSTFNSNKRQGSPLSPARSRSLSSTPQSKQQKEFPIIYLNLSGLKCYSGKDDGNNSEPASPSKDSNLDGEPVKLDGESLQAAYDLLTLCSPRGSCSRGSSKKDRFKEDIVKSGALPKETFSKAGSNRASA